MLLKQAFKNFDNSGAPCGNKRFLASKGVFLAESEWRKTAESSP